MRSKWAVASSVALLALMSVIVLSQMATQALVPSEELEVFKSVSPAEIAPDRSVVNVVTLTNTSGEALVLSSLVDTLPPDFEYIGLALDSEWDVEPWDKTPPDIQWSGPITVPAFASLTLRYNVYVPASVALRAEPYTNTVVADVEGTLYEGEAGLLVVVGDVLVEKTSASPRVEPGEVATYTVTFSNSGYLTATLDTVWDILPDDVTFKRMTGASDVSDEPELYLMPAIYWGHPVILSIGPLSELVLEYEVTMPQVSETVTLENRAWGVIGGAEVGPDSVEVKVGRRDWTYFPIVTHNYAAPRFTVSKTAYPRQVYKYPDLVEAVFTYTVALRNEGSVPGVLEEIHDTLPPGFEFDAMVEDESDVDDGPELGATNVMTWPGPFIVDGQSPLTLVYRVTSDPNLGTYVNSATATTQAGKGVPPQTPGHATVDISEPVFLEESWETPSPHWEPFTNWWRLNEEQWYRAGGQGVGGSVALRHTYYLGVGDPADGAHDALYMYKDPEAEEWRNYRYEAMVKLDDTNNKYQGLWFRGIHRESTIERRHVEGYVVTWRVNKQTDNIQLIRFKPYPEAHTYPYDLANPISLAHGTHWMGRNVWYHVAVEVIDDLIRVYVNDELVITHVDDTWPTGTVGMFAYQLANGVWDDILVTPIQ
jgi:uncharacterized repeat protein (TIGR01451 family)